MVGSRIRIGSRIRVRVGIGFRVKVREGRTKRRLDQCIDPKKSHNDFAELLANYYSLY